MARKLGAVAQFLAERFNGILREYEDQITIGVAVGQIVPHDPERVSLTLANHGAADVYVSPTEQVSVTRGIRIAAGGGAMSVNVEEDGNMSALSWWGISGGAGNVVYALMIKREVALRDLEG